MWLLANHLTCICPSFLLCKMIIFISWNYHEECIKLTQLNTQYITSAQQVAAFPLISANNLWPITHQRSIPGSVALTCPSPATSDTKCLLSSIHSWPSAASKACLNLPSLFSCKSSLRYLGLVSSSSRAAPFRKGGGGGQWCCRETGQIPHLQTKQAWTGDIKILTSASCKDTIS